MTSFEGNFEGGRPAMRQPANLSQDLWLDMQKQSATFNPRRASENDSLSFSPLDYGSSMRDGSREQLMQERQLMEQAQQFLLLLRQLLIALAQLQRGMGGGGSDGSQPGKPGDGGGSNPNKPGDGGGTTPPSDGGKGSFSPDLSPIPKDARVWNNQESTEWRKNGNQLETAMPAGSNESQVNHSNNITKMEVTNTGSRTHFYTEGTNYADVLYGKTLTHDPAIQDANHLRVSFDMTGGQGSDKIQANEKDLCLVRKEGDGYVRYMFGTQITTHNELQIWDEKNQHWITAAKGIQLPKPGETYHMDYDFVRLPDGRMWYKGISINGEKIPLDNVIQQPRHTSWKEPSLIFQNQYDLKNGQPVGETLDNLSIAAWQDDTVMQQFQKFQQGQ